MKFFQFNMQIKWGYILGLIMGVLSVGCSSVNRPFVKKQVRKHLLESPLFDNHFSGFALYDPESKQIIYEYQGDRYFTPASNAKLFTLYTTLHVLGDSLPAFSYLTRNDSLIIRGTGDPTLLHPDLPTSSVIPFLQDHQGPIYIDTTQSLMLGLGKGWAWDDYPYYYSCERSNFPIHGNVVRIYLVPDLKIYPSVFQDKLEPRSIRMPNRIQEVNYFYYPNSTKGLRFDDYDVPFIPKPPVVRSILEDTLKTQINFTVAPSSWTFDQVKYSLPTDTVLQKMLHTSDNFLAEQLLILSANQKYGSSDIRNIINWSVDTLMAFLPQSPKWVDGSGLSRYNLSTPLSHIYLLERLYEELGPKRLFPLFPAGGKSGTLEDNYEGDSNPYIYAKTGTLSNNHNLSGFLITEKGKVLIFSIMNNHFMTSSSEVKKEMEALLLAIRKRG